METADYLQLEMKDKPNLTARAGRPGGGTPLRNGLRLGPNHTVQIALIKGAGSNESAESSSPLVYEASLHLRRE